MKKKNDLQVLLLTYSIATFFSFAILRYVLFFTFNLNPAAEDRFVVIRVFFSGPVLMAIGVVLRTKFKESGWHRLFGVLFMMGGVVWMALLIKTAIEETA
jgi:hypothetical protein